LRGIVQETHLELLEPVDSAKSEILELLPLRTEAGLLSASAANPSSANIVTYFVSKRVSRVDAFGEEHAVDLVVEPSLKEEGNEQKTR